MNNSRFLEVSYKRFKDRLQKDVYDAILSIDPTAPDYKFGEWLVVNYLNLKKDHPYMDEAFFSEYAPNLRQLLTQYAKIPNRAKPENFTATFRTFTAFKKWMTEYHKSHGGADYAGRMISVPKEEYKIIYEDDEWILTQVFSHRASRFWGISDDMDQTCDGTFCTTYLSSKNWDSFYIEDLNPIVMYLKKKFTPEIWAFVKNDKTNQYQDKENSNPEENTIESLGLESHGVPNKVISFLEDNFPQTIKYDFKSYGYFSDTNEFEAIMAYGYQVYETNSYGEEFADVKNFAKLYDVYYVKRDEHTLPKETIQKFTGVFDLFKGEGIVFVSRNTDDIEDLKHNILKEFGHFLLDLNKHEKPDAYEVIESDSWASWIDNKVDYIAFVNAPSIFSFQRNYLTEVERSLISEFKSNNETPLYATKQQKDKELDSVEHLEFLDGEI